jgi:hypothetical protein
MFRSDAPAARSAFRALIAFVLAIGVVGCGSSLPAATDRLAIPESSLTLSAPPDVAAALPLPSTVAPSPVASAPPTASPTPEPPREAFAMNLYRRGDYVAQYTLEWCVGASLQMALNMTGANDATRGYQQRLWEMAQARSSSPFGGANPRGWTAALNDLGIGPYELVSIADYDEALRVAAAAMRETKRPVGLVMWRGRHAWVMSGFESIGDPALHDDITITGIRVLDPLYPRDSRTWGASPKPNSLLTPATLAKQFVIRDRGRTNLGVPPGYLLVLPTVTTPSTPAD